MEFVETPRIARLELARLELVLFVQFCRVGETRKDRGVSSRHVRDQHLYQHCDLHIDTNDEFHEAIEGDHEASRSCLDWRSGCECGRKAS